MLKQILFFALVVMGISIQRINPMECLKCTSLQNSLEASLSEQQKLLRMNIKLATENQELMKKQIVLLQQHDTLVNLNTQLTQTLSHMLNLHRTHKKNTRNFILPNNRPIEYKSFYFTTNAYRSCYQTCTDSHCFT